MNKKLSRIFAAILAMVLCVAMAIPVLADEPTAETGKGKITITTTLTMKENAAVPAANFTFTLSAATGTKKAPDYNGDMTGLETTYTASFTGSEDASVAGGKKTVSTTFEIDFTTVTFENPGVYHYVLTETEPSSPYSISEGSNKEQYIDVYVVIDDKTGELSIQTVMLYASAEDAEKDAKSEGFANDYNTIDLTLSKTVAGNQGNRNEYFEFEIELTNVAIDGTYVITGGTYGEGSAASIVVTDHTGKATVFLKHGESVKIEGLPEGTSYTITEKGAEDYDTTVNGTDTEDKKASGENLEADAAVAYTNTRGGTIPTGILLTVAPFAVLMVIGVIGVVFFSLKKRGNAK